MYAGPPWSGPLPSLCLRLLPPPAPSILFPTSGLTALPDEHIKPIPATESFHLMVPLPRLLKFVPSLHSVLLQLVPHWEAFSSYLEGHIPHLSHSTPFSCWYFFQALNFPLIYDVFIYFLYLPNMTISALTCLLLYLQYQALNEYLLSKVIGL